MIEDYISARSIILNITKEVNKIDYNYLLLFIKKTIAYSNRVIIDFNFLKPE